jgi:hypothetical protein
VCEDFQFDNCSSSPKQAHQDAINEEEKQPVGQQIRPIAHSVKFHQAFHSVFFLHHQEIQKHGNGEIESDWIQESADQIQQDHDVRIYNHGHVLHNLPEERLGRVQLKQRRMCKK